ncbi:hypothetical protein ES703_115957 [subsurface metagenome]
MAVVIGLVGVAPPPLVTPDITRLALGLAVSQEEGMPFRLPRKEDLRIIAVT